MRSCWSDWFEDILCAPESCVSHRLRLWGALIGAFLLIVVVEPRLDLAGLHRCLFFRANETSGACGGGFQRVVLVQVFHAKFHRGHRAACAKYKMACRVSGDRWGQIAAKRWSSGCSTPNITPRRCSIVSRSLS